MANKTQPTPVDPAAYLDGLPKAGQREDGRALLALMSQVSGEPAVMWGPTMVGFGNYHYRYASGREGDAFRMGFSPRSTALVLYGDAGRLSDVLARLGPHTTGKSCIYLKRLSDADPAVLRELVERMWEPPGEA
ncbi:MAG: DUF1801 domain-containing protein [Propionicimonas sp.]|nr:DUF1801 domain-containing protein [Propionicimonas sp.]